MSCTERATNLASKCERLALATFGGIKKDDLPKYGLKYRKGKTWADVVLAAKKGMNDGMGRTETEIDMIAFRLSRVLKQIKRKQ